MCGIVRYLGNRQATEVHIPKVDDMFASITAVIPIQLLANIRGLDVDKPRNLAKSVTVE